MSTMDSIEIVGNLLNSCLLPELQHDCDSIAIEKAHFKSYHERLEIQLPLLFDCIQQERSKWIFDQEIDEPSQKIQANIVIFLCELTSPNSLYRLENAALISNAERILADYKRISSTVEQIIFRYYEKKLHKDVWKKQLGPVHGYIQYLKFRYSSCLTSQKNMNQQHLMFCLSFGLNTRSSHEAHYKYLSTSAFLIMLNHGTSDDILSMNIHSVIYDAVFKDLHIMDSISFIECQWNCLIRCLQFYRDIDSFKWNQLDDLLEQLLSNISLAPNSLASISLMKYVSKLVVYFNINQKEFEEKLKLDLTTPQVLIDLRFLGSNNTSFTCHRWAKAILEMFILESYRLMQFGEICIDLLTEIHRCYIVTILPIALPIIEQHLIIFLEKFTAILMDISKVQKYNEDIMRAITSILETFFYHLQSCENLAKLLTFKEAYYKLLKMEPFKKYCTI